MGSPAMLERAIARQSASEVKRLIATGCDLDAVFPGGFHTPLTLATTAGNLELVRILLDAGADPLVRWSGDCPIHAACQVGVAQWIARVAGCQVEGAGGGALPPCDFCLLSVLPESIQHIYDFSVLRKSIRYKTRAV